MLMKEKKRNDDNEMQKLNDGKEGNVNRIRSKRNESNLRKKDVKEKL